jgi:hypothetical protein
VYSIRDQQVGSTPTLTVDNCLYIRTKEEIVHLLTANRVQSPFLVLHVKMNSCQFPTTRRDRAKGTGYQVISVASASTQFDNHNWFSDDFIQASWAILLSHYVRKEQVSFAILGSPDDIDNMPSRGADFLPGVQVLQYNLEPSHQLQQIHPQAKFKSTVVELLEHKINTAINSSGGCLSSIVGHSFDPFNSLEFSVRSSNVSGASTNEDPVQLDYERQKTQAVH